MFVKPPQPNLAFSCCKFQYDCLRKRHLLLNQNAAPADLLWGDAVILLWYRSSHRLIVLDIPALWTMAANSFLYNALSRKTTISYIRATNSTSLFMRGEHLITPIWLPLQNPPLSLKSPARAAKQPNLIWNAFVGQRSCEQSFFGFPWDDTSAIPACATDGYWSDKYSGGVRYQVADIWWESHYRVFLTPRSVSTVWFVSWLDWFVASFEKGCILNGVSLTGLLWSRNLNASFETNSSTTTSKNFTKTFTLERSLFLRFISTIFFTVVQRYWFKRLLKQRSMNIKIALSTRLVHKIQFVWNCAYPWMKNYTASYRLDRWTPWYWYALSLYCKSTTATLPKTW